MQLACLSLFLSQQRALLTASHWGVIVKPWMRHCMEDLYDLQYARHGMPRYLFALCHADIVDYTYFKAGVEASAFDTPAPCAETALLATKSRYRSFPRQMKAYLPYVLFSAPQACSLSCLPHLPSTAVNCRHTAAYPAGSAVMLQVLDLRTQLMPLSAST